MSGANTTYDPEALEHDIAQHEAAKERGERGLTIAEALAWLRREREERRGHPAAPWSKRRAALIRRRWWAERCG